MMTVVAAVCVNFRSSDHVRRLLDSISSSNISEIHILDNYSDEAEAERLKAVAERHPRVRLHFSRRNLGFGAGVNRLVAALADNVEYVWILNPDVTVEAGALDILVASAKASACEIVSPLVLSGDGRTIWYAGGVLDYAGGRSIHSGIGQTVSNSIGGGGFQIVSFMTGAAPLVSLAAWQKLGGFDESLFLYCEDADLSIRAGTLGLSMGVERRSVVRHAEGGSSGGSSRVKSGAFYYFVQRNRLRVYSQGRGKLSVLIGPGIAETLRLTLAPLRKLDRGAPKRFLWSLRGILAGLKDETGPGKFVGGRQ